MKRYAIGIDIGGTSIKFGLIAKKGNIVKSFSSITESTRASISETIVSGCSRLLQYAKENDYYINHIGIASPGAVNTETGLIFGSSPNIPGWIGTNLFSIVRGFKIPVYTDNDANAAGIGETLFGTGVGFKDILYITIGTGVGAGIIIGGKIHRGTNHAAAEIGHIVIYPNGRKCGCGNRGCMERYASITGLMITAKQILSRKRSGKLWRMIGGDLSKLKPEMITGQFKKGDKIAGEIINRQAHDLAIGIAGAVNLLNPELIIIGGAISEAGKIYINKISNYIIPNVFPAANQNLKIVRAKLGRNAGIVGAASLGWI
ncbi:MAG: ROK family protein [candidate division Zixibacteria bacterium]|nr:ROK family protein [candidate division Zixibacteria bacterium]